MNPKLFLFGACDLQDIAMSHNLRKRYDVVDAGVCRSAIDNSSLDFFKRGMPIGGTSLMSLYSMPGSIAQRVFEEYNNLDPESRIELSGVYDSVLKFPYFNFYKQIVGPDDYLLINFTAEIYTKFYNQTECFTLTPHFSKTVDPRNPLHWLFAEYLSKDEYTLAFDTEYSLGFTRELLVDFAKDIYSIFQDRVILVKTHFSNLVIGADHHVRKYESSERDIFLYKTKKIISENRNLQYAERLAAVILNGFCRYFPVDIPVVRLDEPVYMDSNHRWGLAHFHIDSFSRAKLADKIIQILDSKQNEKSSKLIQY